MISDIKKIIECMYVRKYIHTNIRCHKELKCSTAIYFEQEKT
jgi:hypothetical protein